MYATRGGLTLGFHGCDATVLENVVSGGSMLRESRNRYDWLGHGIYFWENSPARALAFAEELQQGSSGSSGRIQKPAVIGAVLDLGYCLDLFDFENLSLIRQAYTLLEQTNMDMPENRKGRDSEDLLLRDLDCAVLEMLHYYRQLLHLRPFDSVRGAFQEGKELYPNAGFREKDHIQICVRNPNCIKGLFIPRREDAKFPAV